MSNNKIEYIIRIGPSDRYRHLHIKERGKILFFRVQKEKEMIERNIELSAEFSRYLFEHPELEEKIPIGTEIILLPEFDKELKEYNLGLGRNIESEDGKVTYVAIKNIRPKLLSRIEEVELESAA